MSSGPAVEAEMGHAAVAMTSPASSYRGALKATALSGASNFAELALRLVKAKVIAVRLGPQGIGLFGILTAVTGLVSSVASLGITSSGVRQVAAACSSSDDESIARVVFTLRRTSLILGLLGTLLLAITATPLARVFAGSDEHARWLLLLAPLILLGSVNGGQTALLRGLRRIGDLARLRIIGAVVGTTFAVPLVWFLGWLGIPLAMLATSATSLASSWWYARRVRIIPLNFTAHELWSEARLLFSLGAAFLITDLQGPIVQNALRAILLRQTDLATVGQFLAAFSLSHTFVGFVLKAMGMDYLPRLTKHHNDPVTLNRLANEQTEIALLVATPATVALVVLAPLVIPLLYSHRFDAAVEVFRWQCLGVLLKVASWPLGYVLKAQGRRVAIVATETITNLFYVGIFGALVFWFGLLGAALSFALLYLWYLALIFSVVRSATGFAWSLGSGRTLLVALLTLTVALLIVDHVEGAARWLSASALVVVTCVWAYRGLERRLQMAIAPHLYRLFQRAFQGTF